VRLLRLTEEAGEVAEAFIGMHGLNGRKGFAELMMTCSMSLPM
jgi:NTP pyrophosphatase (non-canonical NTP hydrolase)